MFSKVEHESIIMIKALKAVRTIGPSINHRLFLIALMIACQWPSTIYAQ